MIVIFEKIILIAVGMLAIIFRKRIAKIWILHETRKEDKRTKEIYSLYTKSGTRNHFVIYSESIVTLVAIVCIISSAYGIIKYILSLNSG